METRRFYRVSNEETNQGLWYNYQGTFTGLIHNEFSFCHNRELRMDYDPELVGFVSVVETKDLLMLWFSEFDVIRLQKYGYFIHIFESNDYKWYDRFQHYVINQKTARVVEKIVIPEYFLTEV